MTIPGVESIGPRPIAPVADEAPRALGGAPANAAFRRLLERLEGLARAPAEPVADAEGLQRALRQADDGYVAAMDLRRRLEDAIAAGALGQGRPGAG